jgi:hypothetical protein
MITVLSTMLFGVVGANAMTLMYIFFLIGNFLTPKFLSLFGHDMGLLMFYTSLIFTLFAISSTGMILSLDDHQILLDSNSIMVSIFYTSAVILGFFSAMIWVAYGVLNINISELIAKKFLYDYLYIDGNLLEPNIDEKVLLDQLTEITTGQVMSTGWSLLSFNTVIGGLLTYWVLNVGDRNVHNGDDNNITSSNRSLVLLFGIFILVSILANLSYYILYRVYSSEVKIIDQVNDNKNNINESSSLLSQLSPKFHSYGSTDQNYNQNDGLVLNSLHIAPPEDAELNLDNNVEKVNYLNLIDEQNQSIISENPPPTPEIPQSISLNSNQPPRDEIIPDDHDNYSELSQFELFIDLLKTRYIQYSIPQYIFAGVAFNWLWSSFLPHIVKGSLGVSNSPLIIAAAYTTNTIISFFIGDFISTHKKARLISIVGNFVQMLPIFAALFLPLTFFSGSDLMISWLTTVIIALVAGLGDAIHSTALTTVMASDLRLDESLGGCRYANVPPKMVKELKSIVYSVYSATKSIGVFLTFFLSGHVTFQTQGFVILGAGAVALLAQIGLFVRMINFEKIPDDE